MTPGRVFVLLILAVGGIGTLVNGAVYYVRLLYLGALLLVLAWLLTALSLRGIVVERRARSSRAGVGDVFEEHFEIANNSRITKLWLEVANETKIPNATGSRVVTLLRGRQKRSYTARTWLTSRGGFTLGPTTLTSGDPFGIFRVSRQFPAVSNLVVFPMLFPVRDFLSPPGLLPGGKAIRRKSIDITPHASGVREYVPGDPMKRIHWPTSVRRDRLMVKEFEQDPQAEVLVLPRYAQKCSRCTIRGAVFNPASRRPAPHPPPQGETDALHARVFHQHYRLPGALFHRTAPLRGCGDRLRKCLRGHPCRTQ